MVSSGVVNGFVRSFAVGLNLLKTMQQRCNVRYDTLLALKQFRDFQRTQLSKKDQKEQEKVDQQKNRGILGPCLLRSCSMFDVGHSFMSDSLHNVYIGAFKRMMSLWFSPDYRTEPWSIHNHLEELSRLFKQVRLPSTTTRLPRVLTAYSNYKANEFRVLLLFGHVIFAEILPKMYYDHLLQLVCLLHLAENRRIHKDDVKVIEKLGTNFVISFSRLYTPRHCVQVVYSVFHIGATVRYFGPLTNYTTFNFENQLGLLTRTCKSTRRHAEEIIANLYLLQSALHHLHDPILNFAFKKQILSIINENEDINNNDYRTSRKNDKINAFATVLFPKKQLNFFHQLQIRRMKLNTYSSAVGKCADDSTIVFRIDEKLFMGRIQSIFTLVENSTTFLLVDYPNVTNYFTCSVDKTDDFKYSSIQSCLKNELSVRLIQPSDIIEKCVYFEHPNRKCYFMRFPNLVHSS
ncbi:unnamed protein product [Rotaria magnacalcarata]